MDKTFNYREKYTVWLIWGPLIFFGLAVVFYLRGWGLAYRNVTVAPYPYSYYVFIGLGIFSVLFAIVTLKDISDGKKNPEPIRMKDTGFSFPKGKNETVELEYSQVNKLEEFGDEDKKGVFHVYTKDIHEIFHERNFDSQEDYAQLANILEERCKNAKIPTDEN